MFYLGVALLRSFLVLVTVLPRAIMHALWWNPPSEWPRPVSSGTRTLIVLLHGVNQKHSIWKVVVEELLRSIPPDCAVYAPFFDHSEPLVALASEVAQQIEPYAGRGIDVRVVGFSNGGRVAMHLESMRPGHTFVLVGAPINGTRILELLPDSVLTWKISPFLLREMRTKRFVPSPSSRIQAFAADWDEVVFPPDRCAPQGIPVTVLRGNFHHTLFRSREVIDAIVQNKNV